MKNLILLSLIVSIFTFNLRQAKQSYDSYVMAVQWSNGYCQLHNCEEKADHIEKNTFTIHGLWPSLRNGKNMRPCTFGIEVYEDDSTLYDDMKKHWPSLQGPNENFWEHELNKHGYCMMEDYGWDDYEEYFLFVLDLFVTEYKNLLNKAFPDLENITINVSYDDLKEKIQNIIPNATFQMKCKSDYITEFYFYLNKDFKPSVNSRFSNKCKFGKLVFK